MDREERSESGTLTRGGGGNGGQEEGRETRVREWVHEGGREG